MCSSDLGFLLHGLSVLLEFTVVSRQVVRVASFVGVAGTLGSNRGRRRRADSGSSWTFDVLIGNVLIAFAVLVFVLCCVLFALTLTVAVLDRTPLIGQHKV